MNSQESTQTNEELEQKLTELNGYIDKAMEKKNGQKIPDSKYLQRADVLIALGRFDDALSDLREVFADHGRIFGDRTYGGGIGVYCDKILAKAPNHLQASVLKAESLYRQKKFDDAVIVLKQVLEMRPDDGAMWDWLGRAYYQQQNYSEAIDAFNHATELLPENKDIWVDRALAKACMKQLDDAINDLNSQRSESESEILLFLLGVLQFDKKEYRESIRVLTQLIEKMAKDFAAEDEIPAQELEYHIFYRNQEMDKNRLWSEACVALGVAYLCIDSAKEAEDCFAKALSKIETDIDDKQQAGLLQLWLMNCYGRAVKLSDYNSNVVQHHDAFAKRYGSTGNPGFFTVLMSQYNSGNYDFVLKHADEAKRVGGTPITIHYSDWDQANWQPHALILKAFSMGLLGMMDQASDQIREACRMFYSPESYYENQYPDRGQPLLYAQLFHENSMNPTGFVESMFGARISFWNDGNMFDRGTQIEMLLQGFLLVQEGAYDEAYEKSQEWESKFGKHYLTSYIQGLYWKDKKNVEKAMSSFSESIELGNMDAHCYYNRALQYGKIGKNDEAFRDFSNAVSLKPDFALAYLERGNLLLKIGKIPEACSDYEQAHSLDPAMHKQFSYEFIAKQVAEHERAIAAAVIRAKDDLMQGFSHKMKNSFPKAITEIEFLRDELGENVHLNKSVSLLRRLEKLAHAINFSFKGGREELVADLGCAEGGQKISKIIAAALDNALANLLDESGIYAEFSRLYFDLTQKKAARGAYRAMGERTLDALTGFMRDQMLDLTIEIDSSADLPVGNTHHTMTKLTEIIEELVFNAVKYAGTAPRGRRTMRVSLSKMDGRVALIIENAHNRGDGTLKTSGFGRQIVTNTLEPMGVGYEVKETPETYSTQLVFPIGTSV